MCRPLKVNVDPPPPCVGGSSGPPEPGPRRALQPDPPAATCGVSIEDTQRRRRRRRRSSDDTTGGSGGVDRIRSRYFDRIGVSPPPSPPPPGSASPLVSPWSEALKRDYGEVDEELTRLRLSLGVPLLIRRNSSPAPPAASSDASSSSGGSEGRSVSFGTSVQVMPIPMRKDYSARIRPHLWATSKQRREDVWRNTVEYDAEGRDWRRALEDHEFFVDVATGEKIHPVHCVRYIPQKQKHLQKQQQQQPAGGKNDFLEISRRKAKSSRT